MKPGKRTNGPAGLRLSYCVAAPAHLRGGMLEITSLLTAVGERGKGHASELLASVCAEADKAGKLLLIQPQPFDAGSMTQDQLTAWYAGHGFEVLQVEPELLLVRQSATAKRIKES